MADNELRRRRLKIIQVLLLVDDLEDEKGRNRERITWTRSWIRRREKRGVSHQLIRELAFDDVALKVSGGVLHAPTPTKFGQQCCRNVAANRPVHPVTRGNF